MLFHYTARGNVNTDWIPVSFPYLSQICQYGYLGVDLFFMISGFVIYMSADDRTAKSFLISRVVRLYPAYWVCCTLTFLITFFWGVSSLKVSWPVYAMNLSMLHGFFNIEHVDSVYWSLFVELKFYLIVTAIIFFRQMHHMRYFLGIWLIISLITLKYPIPIIGDLLITAQSAYFISGAVFYLIWKEGWSTYKAVLLIGSYFLALNNAMGLTHDIYQWHGIVLDKEIVAVLLMFCYGLFFVLVNGNFNFVRGSLVVTLGALTYPLYLVHQSIGFVLFKTFGSLMNKYVLLLLIMVVMCWVAYFVYICIEKKYSLVFKNFLERRFS